MGLDNEFETGKDIELLIHSRDEYGKAKRQGGDLYKVFI